MYHVLALCITAVSITTVLNDDMYRFVLFSTCVRATTGTGCLLSQIRFEFSYISTDLCVIVNV